MQALLVVKKQERFRIVVDQLVDPGILRKPKQPFEPPLRIKDLHLVLLRQEQLLRRLVIHHTKKIEVIFRTVPLVVECGDRLACPIEHPKVAPLETMENNQRLADHHRHTIEQVFLTRGLEPHQAQVGHGLQGDLFLRIVLRHIQ